MLVKDLMTKKVLTVGPDTPVSEVAQLLHEHRFIGVPVVDDKNRLLGVVSERDFITEGTELYLPTYIQMLSSTAFVQSDNKSMPEEAKRILSATAQDIMNRDPATVVPAASLEYLAEVYVTKRANPIPVIDTERKLVGIISRSDLIQLFSPLRLAALYHAPEQPHLIRPIDVETEKSLVSFQSKFAYVAKARANIWLTTAVVLFAVGFFTGIVYVVDPHIW